MAILNKYQNIDTNPWELKINISQAGSTTNVLSTAGTFLDRNILFTTETPSAIMVASPATLSKYIIDGTNAGINTTNLLLGEPQGIEPNSGYYIAITGEGGSNISQAGWINSGISTTATGTSYFPLTLATFRNDSTSGVTYTDISDTAEAPILISNDYLYINEGYTSNKKISLAKLIPDFNSNDYIAGTSQMLQGYKAYDQDGDILIGTIPSKSSATYNVSTSDRTINSGYYLSGDQVIKGVYISSGLTASNIKVGTQIKIGDENSNGRLKNITGNFTDPNTVSSGQIAANNEQLLSGYSAWVNGIEIKGSINNGSGITFSGKTATLGAGYYASAVSADMSLATIKSGTAVITSLTYTYDDTSEKFNITGQKTISAPSITTAGYISSTEGTKQSNSNAAQVNTTVNKVKVQAILANTTSAVVTPSISAIKTNSGNEATNLKIDTTTTKPTSAYYVAFKSAAATSNLSISAKVSSAGYGTTANYTDNTSSTSLTMGANASADTYIPIPAGVYSASINSHIISTTPVVTFSSSGSFKTASTYGVTTNKPTGTDGTNFLTIGSDGTVSTTGKSSSISKATISTAGYIPQGNITSTTSTINITPTITNNFNNLYIPITSISFSGGDLSSTSASNTFNTNITTANSDNYNNGLKIQAKGTAIRNKITYSNAAGAIIAHNNTTAIIATAAQEWNGNEYYLKGIKLSTPTTGISCFDITVPNGNSTSFITFHFEVDSNSNVIITDTHTN